MFAVKHVSGLDVTEELKQIADEANNLDFCNKSIQDKNELSFDLDLEKLSAYSKEDEEDSMKESVMSAALSIQGDSGFELSLNGMDLKNLGFLTKFMT